jgi:hypothetical protein
MFFLYRDISPWELLKEAEVFFASSLFFFSFLPHFQPMSYSSSQENSGIMGFPQCTFIWNLLCLLQIYAWALFIYFILFHLKNILVKMLPVVFLFYKGSACYADCWWYLLMVTESANDRDRILSFPYSLSKMDKVVKIFNIVFLFTHINISHEFKLNFVKLVNR